MTSPIEPEPMLDLHRLLPLCETPQEREQLLADCVLDAPPVRVVPDPCDCAGCHFGTGECTQEKS